MFFMNTMSYVYHISYIYMLTDIASYPIALIAEKTHSDIASVPGDYQK